MAKGKGNQPSGFEEFQAAVHRRYRWRRIPSRSDGPDVYPRFRLQPPNPVKWRPLWVNLLVLTGFVAPFGVLIVLVGYRRPDFWFFLLIVGMIYGSMVAGVLSVWQSQARRRLYEDTDNPGVDEENESL